MFGDENPFNISPFGKDLKVEDELFRHFGGHTASSGGETNQNGQVDSDLFLGK